MEWHSGVGSVVCWLLFKDVGPTIESLLFPGTHVHPLTLWARGTYVLKAEATHSQRETVHTRSLHCSSTRMQLPPQIPPPPHSGR